MNQNKKNIKYQFLIFLSIYKSKSKYLESSWSEYLLKFKIL